MEAQQTQKAVPENTQEIEPAGTEKGHGHKEDQVQQLVGVRQLMEQDHTGPPAQSRRPNQNDGFHRPQTDVGQDQSRHDQHQGLQQLGSQGIEGQPVFK